MSYVEDNLIPNEKVIFRAKLHPAIFLPAIVALIGAIFFVIFSFSTDSNPRYIGSSGSSLAMIFLCFGGLLFLFTVNLALQAGIIMLSTEFAVTNRRVIAKMGFIRRHTLELFLQKVESVQVYQGILGRLLNFGVVEITGTGGTRESFKAIIDPIGVRRKINQVIEHYTSQASAPLKAEQNPL
jgi:uncharacterized membrane protein YdbT with pleckstrin-like domain